MHDPLVVAFEIRRPWPTKSRSRHTRVPRWKISLRSAFWHLAGREYYWPSLITIWHREPNDHDALTVCDRKSRWRWHIHHWRIQVAPVQTLHRWLFERCIKCGHRYPWGYAPIAHQWDEPRGKWWRITRRAYHHACSSLVHYERMASYDKNIIRRLTAEIRVRADETETELVERLTDAKRRDWEFHLAHRLQRLLGYERDDDYQLVRKDAER